MTQYTIGILETGRPPEQLQMIHGDYPSMVKTWLDDLGQDTVRYAVLDGEMPDDVGEVDLWVITGSRFGVYEDHPWIAPLETFIRKCHMDNVPMFGICFGHQIIAQALGGVVERSDKGWGVGVNDYTPKNWPTSLGDAPDTITIQAYHQDQVATLPDDAQVIATSQFCEHASIWYPGFAVTVQGHPEFAKPYASALIASRRGTLLTDAQADAGLASMTKTDNRDQTLTLLRALLKA